MPIIDLTPKGVKNIPSKNKVVLPDETTSLGQQVGGWTIGSNDLAKGNVRLQADQERILIGSATAPLTGTGIFIGLDGADYEFRAGNPDTAYIHWDGTALTVSSITLTGGTIKYGKTSFSDSTNAGYYVSSEGLYIGAAADATKLKYTLADASFDFIGTISSRATSTVAGAITAAGNFIDANLDTFSRVLLKDFTFSPSDYSGAFKSGDITWNTSTGAITGGSGVLMYKNGLIGANSGNATFILDATTGNATFGGSVVGASINIPDATNPKFSVDTSGNMVAKSISIIQQYTAGENLTKGRLGVLKHKICSWGDDALADKDTTAILSDFVYVDEGDPTTNKQGGATPLTLVKLGITTSPAGNHLWIYGKINLTGTPPNLPGWEEVEDVRLRIYVGITTVAAQTQTCYLRRLTAAFDSTTITWNNKPANDGKNWATASTGTAVLSETMAITSGLKNTGYIEFDITNLYRLWELGTYANYGFVIIGGNDSADGYSQVGGITRVGGDSFEQAPYLRIIPTVDNPGSGNVITVNDGKVYHADYSDYQKHKNIIGIVGETKNSGQTFDMYPLAEGITVPNSVLSVSSGRIYWLTGTAGEITTIVNDSPDNSGMIKIGKGTLSGLQFEKDTSPILIKIGSYTAPMLPPPMARMAIIYWLHSVLPYEGSVITVRKGSFASHDEFRNWDSTGPTGIRVTVSWAAGTSGLLSVNYYNGAGVELTTNLSTTIYWYK